jgi:hypothetical protein
VAARDVQVTILNLDPSDALMEGSYVSVGGVPSGGSHADGLGSAECGESGGCMTWRSVDPSRQGDGWLVDYCMAN